MLAGELIAKMVKRNAIEKAHVRAIIPEKDSWWHVHKDEELPNNYPVVIYIRAT